MPGLGFEGFGQEAFKEQVAAGRQRGTCRGSGKRTGRSRRGVAGELTNWAHPVGRGLGRPALTVLTPSQGDVRSGCCPQCPQKG